MLPSYTKIAKVEGNLKGAELTWNWTWSEANRGVAPPNVFPLRDSVVVTNKAIGAMDEVMPNAGVLTLTPVVTCGKGILELEPIKLEVGLSFVEPPRPLRCVGLIEPKECPSCDETPGPGKSVHVFVRVGGSNDGYWQPSDGDSYAIDAKTGRWFDFGQLDDSFYDVDDIAEMRGIWVDLGNSGVLPRPTRQRLIMAYAVLDETQSPPVWLSANKIINYIVPNAIVPDGGGVIVGGSPTDFNARKWLMKYKEGNNYYYFGANDRYKATIIPNPVDGSPVPVGCLYWNLGPLKVIPTDPSVKGADFT